MLNITTGERLPSLDGLRAVSICLVLGAHSLGVWNCPDWMRPVVKWGFDGTLGVNVFFIISGFLITWLLIREHERTGGVSLKAFYIRRALRILPIYAAFLGALAVLQATTSFHQPAYVWWANLTFTTNFVIKPVWASGHLWSLAVEEQFYLLWPLLFVILDCQRRPRRALFVLGVPILVAPVARTLNYLGAAPYGLDWLFTDYSFLDRFDGIAIGCASAFLLDRKPHILKAVLIEERHAAACVGLALVSVPYMLKRCFLLATLTVPLAWTCIALGVAVLLLQSVLLGRWSVYAWLNTPVARTLGGLSYSLYVWQQLFCARPEAFGWAPHAWMGFPLWIASALFAAVISYYLWEKPFLSLRARFRTAY